MKRIYWMALICLPILIGCKTKQQISQGETMIKNTTMEKDGMVNKTQHPVTRKGDHVDTYFGINVPDPYRWLEDDRSDETADWVKEQNEVTFGFLDKIPFRGAIKDRLKVLMDYERISAPFKEGNYEYFYKNDGLQDHSVVYRRPKGQPDTEPAIFMDPNTFSEDGTTGLRGMFFTKDGSMLGYMITEGGSDWRKIIVINAEDKKMVGDTIRDVKFSGLSWKGNEGFYYSSYDKVKDASELSAKTQVHKLYYHKLGTAQSADELVFGGEGQENRYVGGYVTEDQRYLVVSAAQNTSGNQLYIKDLQEKNSEFVLVEGDYFSSTEVVDNVGSRFYLQTNVGAPNYRVVTVDYPKVTKEYWKDLIQESENVLSANTGGGKIFANYLVDAKTQVKQYNMDGTLDRVIELPGIGSANGFGAKKEDKDFYYSFTSFTYPSTIFKYDIASGKSTLYKQSKIDFDPSLYETKQVFYSSKDGTKVPMFITHKKGVKLDGTNPTYLYAYGGFNVSLTPRFSASRLVWLENGGIYAQPNLRGGGEYGEKWHLAGTKMNKQNVFDDFIGAAQYLIDNKYTSSGKLAIAGGSNGGLLVGATMAQRPDLAKVALPAVGVMDMLRYHKFTAGAGWAADYGTADDNKEMFEYLRAYSPVHALRKGVAYPATMVTTGDHDDRVVPAHSFKFAATLQEMAGGDNPQLIRIQTKAGHGSVSTTQVIDLQADIYAFCWANMGVNPFE
jgi:prolyl oligopeptidase